jgi:hypothetical protein
MSVAYVRQAVLSICQKTGTLSVRVPMAGIVPNVAEIKYEMGAIGEGYLNLVGTVKEDGWATEAERRTPERARPEPAEPKGFRRML